MGSYPTISPFPDESGGMFLCHFPSPPVCAAGAWALPSALPGGARTFLSDKSERSPGLLDYIYYINLPHSGRSSAWFASSSARLFIARRIESTSNCSNRRRNSTTLPNIGCSLGLRTL